MFLNVQEQTDEARVNRAIDRLKACTMCVDLERVWENCVPLCDHLFDKQKAGSQNAATLLKRMADAFIDARQEINGGDGA